MHTQAEDLPPETSLTAADGTVHVLESPCEIGRTDECLITLDDTQVSRTHCLIQQDSSGNWWITDLDSTNGTYINHRKLSQATKLVDGDVIFVGSVEFTFKGGKPQEKKVEEKTDDADQADGTNIIFSQTKCWLLVADIVDSTMHTQNLSPQDLNLKISEWATQCGEIISSHRGDINQYLGDGFFAFWNSKSVESSAIITALREMDALRPHHPLQFRIVLHYGPVQIGGLLNKGEENLTGSAVHFLFKSEKSAGSVGESMFISEAAAEKLDASHLNPIGSFKVPGFPGETQFYSLK